MTSSRSWSEAVLRSAMIYQSRCKPGDLLQHQWITAQAPTLRAYTSTAMAIEAINRCNGSPFIKTQCTCHRSHTSPTRYLNKSSTTNQQQQLAFYGIPSVQVHRSSHRG